MYLRLSGFRCLIRSGKLCSFLIVIASVLAFDAANAQQNGSPQLLPTTVISPTTVATPLEETASSVTVITSADLENQQRRTVPDALATVPGLNVIQTGGPGGITTVFMRGTNANHVKVLINGIEVSDPSSPERTFDFGQLLTADVERIEVLRGPQSGLYGSDAIGGVISITTKRGDGPPHVTAQVEGGSFATFNQTAGVGGSKDNFNYAFNVAHYYSGSTPVTPLDLLSPGQQRINDRYENTSLSTKLGVDLSETFGISLVARYTGATLDFTGDVFPPPAFIGVPAATQSSQTVHQFNSRAEATWSLFDGRFKNYFGANYSNNLNFFFDPDGSPTNTQFEGDRTRVDWRGVAELLPGQTIVLGADRTVERLVTAGVDAQEADSGGFVELQSEFARRLFVTANGRLDDNDQFGSHATYRIASAFILPGPETKLKASYGTAFKAPTLSELHIDFPSFGFVANPNLKPELSSGYDFGFEQPLWEDRVRFGATYFHNSLQDLIEATFSTYENIANARVDGVETFAAASLSPTIKVRTDYTYTRAVDAVTGLELTRRPPHKASLTTEWNATNKLLLSSTILYVSGWVDFDRSGAISRLDAPGYTIVNMSANYAVNKNITMFARIDNLFDKHYEDPTGFLRPGIGAYAGLRLTN